MKQIQNISFWTICPDTLNYIVYIADCLYKNSVPKLKIADVKTPANRLTNFFFKKNTAPDISDVYDLTLNDEQNVKTVYYISDIHLEHQLEKILKKKSVSLGELSKALDRKISEMLTGINNTYNYLLVGGDVGHHKWLVTLFYRKLLALWDGTIVSILGNHELWDDNTGFLKRGSASRSVSEIVNDYRERIQASKDPGNACFYKMSCL